MAVAVLNGTAQPLAAIQGAHCPLTDGSAPPLPTGTSDSPAVAGKAWDDFGRSWVSVEPSLTSMTMVAFAGGVLYGVPAPGAWAMIYSPCDPLVGGSTSQTAFIAGYNLTSGALEGSFTHALQCPS